MKKKVTRKFKSGGLHERHVVATRKHVSTLYESSSGRAYFNTIRIKHEIKPTIKNYAIKLVNLDFT